MAQHRIADRTRWLLARWPCVIPRPPDSRDQATQGDQTDRHHSDAIATARTMRDESGT